MFDLNIIIPVYNDWESVALLVDKIKLNVNQPYKIIIVNDFSSLKCPVSLDENPDIIILNLIRNLGHQRAICVGLSYVYEISPGSPVVIMDGDGEDRPEDIRLLIQEGTEKGCVSFAKRTNRLEGKIFGILYSLYKKMFRLLTGQTINFGNYSYIPSGYLKNVVYLSEIWNNYPAGVIFAKLPVSTVPIAKGTRLAGKSKMNHYSLIHHGLRISWFDYLFLV
jgi:glycosyltransferase involved in cell wall biosynthesis